MATRATILNTTLTAIANAIRAKTGKTEALLPSAMPGEIQGITTGVNTSDATATAAHILSGKTAYGAAGTKLTGTIPSKATATFTPSTVNQTIAAGQYLSGAQTIKGDANLLAANIKAGVSIFGRTGTLPIVAFDNVALTPNEASAEAYSLSLSGTTLTISLPDTLIETIHDIVAVCIYMLSIRDPSGITDCALIFNRSSFGAAFYICDDNNNDTYECSYTIVGRSILIHNVPFQGTSGFMQQAGMVCVI